MVKKDVLVLVLALVLTLALALVVALVFSNAPASRSADFTPDLSGLKVSPPAFDAEDVMNESDGAAVREYFDKNGVAFRKAMNKVFEPSNYYADTYLEVVGDGVVINFYIEGLNEIPESAVSEVSDALYSLGDSFDELYASLKTKVPELGSLTVNFCEEDGDVLATIVEE